MAGASLFFRSLQKQVGWLELGRTTKTAHAFDALKKEPTIRGGNRAP